MAGIQPEEPSHVRLIAFTGYAGAGKDAAAATLVGIGYRRVAFADPLKQMLAAMLDVPRERLEDRAFKDSPVPGLGKTPRELLQTLGTEWGRAHVAEDLWVRLAMQRAAQHALVVMPDCRFPNEARAVRAAGGVVVHVVRPGVGPVNSHLSDAGLPPELIDRVLLNAGSLAELQAHARDLPAVLRRERRSVSRAYI